MPAEFSQKSTPRRGLVIGAVGHRYLPGERIALLDSISRVLDDVTGDSNEVVVLVSVAEGADRLIIEAAALLGIPYTCVLPCPADRFEEDFSGASSILEFRRFLTGASKVVQPENEPSDRISGYLWASHFIVDRADTLIAVWDGQPANGPAGTGYAIEEAGVRCVPVIWIPTEAPHEPIALELATSTFDEFTRPIRQPVERPFRCGGSAETGRTSRCAEPADRGR